MDEKLSCCDYLPYIKNKIAKGVGIISKARLLNNETLCTLYHCFVYPHLNYGVEVWGATFKTHLRTLVKLQERVLRIISYSTWNASVDHLYKHYGNMQLKKIHFFIVALLAVRVKICLHCLFSGNFSKKIDMYMTTIPGKMINSTCPTLSEITCREQLIIKEKSYGIIFLCTLLMIVHWHLLPELCVFANASLCCGLIWR